MPLNLVLTGVGLAISAYGAFQQREAAQEQQAALQISAAENRAQVASQQRMVDIKNARERANTARQARITRGTLAAQGANKGVSSSTGVIGGVASVSTQSATNLGVFGALEANQEDILASQSRQGDAQSQVGQAQADSIMGGTIFSVGSELFKHGGNFKTIFDNVKKP